MTPSGEQKLSFVGKDATFHEWRKFTPCEVEPKVLSGDLASTNALLTEYLAQTATAPDGVWTEAQVAMLAESPDKLTPLLDATDKAITLSRKCGFDPKVDAVSGLLKSAKDLADQARTRVTEAPALAQTLKLKLTVKAWKDAQPAAQESAKTDWCPPKPKPGAMADIFYAAEDETGKIEWLFCDETKVVAAPGTPPAFEAPATMKKKPKDKPYLESAAKYPVSDIQRAPKAGDKPGAPGEGTDGGTPEAVDAGT